MADAKLASGIDPVVEKQNHTTRTSESPARNSQSSEHQGRTPRSSVVIEARPRRRGVPCDGQRLELEMYSRALQGDDLAREAGVSEIVISRARNGDRIERASLLKIVEALHRFPVDPLLAALVGLPMEAPRNKRTVAATSPATVPEANGGTSTAALEEAGNGTAELQHSA